jgi:hypothetical protein
MGAQLMPAWSPVRGDLHVNDARLALVRRITA